MARHPKILAFAGSLRSASFNKMLVKIAAEGASAAGAEVTLIDLKDYPMPVYDGDIEESQGVPENAKTLRKMMVEHDALLIASPEYNSSLTAALKNTIDWISRPDGDIPSLVAFQNKFAAIMGASVGYYGGARGLFHLRSILSLIGVTVLSEQVIVPKAHELFDGEGNLTKESKRAQVLDLGKTLAQTVSKLI